MEEKLKELTKKRSANELPATMKNELRKIWRAETYNRNFSFSTKYTRKGIVQENEAITLYQNYLNRNGNKVFFKKNEKREYNDYVTGLPDLNPIIFNGKKTGFDTKASWELATFPFEEDPLVVQYEYQNQSYIWITDSEEWITASCLVNIHEHGLNNEKMKYFYPLGCPMDADDEYFDEYVEKCKEIEVRLIFDYNRFVEHYPNHQLEISKDEWMETVNPLTGVKGYDIPMVDRVIEKKSIRNEAIQEKFIERINIGREYLCNLPLKK
ncbi:MAG: hypothetical protein GY739_19450 [Mesoflavibacter sp.]|nr:hypothetical protein [Mesoflavibacter sp.]